METNSPDPNRHNLPDDMLEGAQAIAEFLFGPDDKGRNRRRVYHIVETGRLPVFRLGSVLCARKSVLLEFIGQQEGRILSKTEH
jgi:hypothetical protein